MAVPLERSLAELVRPGDVIVVANGTAEPGLLIDALIGVSRNLAGDIRVIQITTSGQEKLAEVSGGRIRLATPSPGPKTRAAIAEGRAELLMVSLGQLANLIDREDLRVDGVLAQLAEPGGGSAYPGLAMDIIKPAFERARFRAVEINDALPKIPTASRYPLSSCDLIVPCHQPPSEEPLRKPFGAGEALAANIAACIPPRATIEIGIGRVGSLLPRALKSRTGLAVFSGMIGDETKALIEEGIVDRPAVAGEPALAVASVMRGSAAFYDWCNGNSRIRLADARETHNPLVLARLPNFVAINGSLQVDLFGNANSLSIGGRLLGGVGGALDYTVAGSYASGSIVALEAGIAGRSSVVPQVDRVMLSGNLVTHVVTEQGIAHLQGKSPGERARAMISVAREEFRAHLQDEARELGLL